MTLSALIDAVRRRYDRLIMAAMIVLLVGAGITLAVLVFGTAALRQGTEEEVARLTPRGAGAVAEDLAVLQGSVARLGQPPVLEVGGQAIFGPEMRTACVQCARPIAVDADLCPFCGVEQPPDDDPAADSDGDGMPDEWEKRYGLDPRDPTDAALDMDEDCFTNLEEYQARTDPTDAASAPPITSKVSLLNVEPRPFKFIFQGVNRGADGELSFQINNIITRQSYFRKMQGEAEGFRVVEYLEKKEMQEVGGIKRTVDVSELVIQRDQQKIRLVLGRPQLQLDFTAVLRSDCDGGEHHLKRGDDLTLAGKVYRVIGIDTRPAPVVILRDGQSQSLSIFLKNPIDDRAGVIPLPSGGR